MTLRTRQPSGRVAYPIVLVEGAEKTGKSYESFALSASEKVGRTFVFDFGEGAADEYGPLGRFEIIEHDGTFTDFEGLLIAACDEASEDGKPNVIVIDSVTVLWEALKDWTSKRARNSNANRRLLAQDPDAEINVSNSYWNDANDRWGLMLHHLRRWPGVAVLIARGKEVAKIGRDGNPVAGQTEYRVEAQKMLPYNVTAQVRCLAPKQSRLIAVRSLKVELPTGGLKLPAGKAVEHAVFDIIGAGSEWQVSGAVEPKFGRTVANAKNMLVHLFEEAEVPDPKAAAQEVWAAGPLPTAGAGEEVTAENWAALVAAASARIDEAA